MAKFVKDKIENIFGKEKKNAFHTMFSKGFFFRVFKSGLCGKQLIKLFLFIVCGEKKQIAERGIELTCPVTIMAELYFL